MNKAQTITPDLIRCAWRSLVANRLRSALAALGIAVGVFSIISVMTTIAVLQKSIETGVGFLGANTFQFAKFPATINTSGDERFQNRPNIDYQTYATFSRLMGSHAEVICPKIFDKNVQAVFQNRKTNPNVEICGTNENFVSVNRFSIRTGRNLSPDDMAFSRDFCVVGSAIVERLFPDTSAIGKTIRIDRKNYVVIGTFEHKGNIFGEDLDNQVIIPVTTFLENYGAYSRSINIAVESKDQGRYARTLSYAVGAFRQARGLQLGEPDNFEIYSNDSLLLGFRSIADKVQVGAFVISAVALIAAGVGIMNVMLVVVTERTREIGIRKSLGAKAGDIRRQFLFEALLLSAVGAVGGIFFGVIAGNLLAWFLRAEPVFPLAWSIAGVITCSGVGIVFGLYPARKAALLNPLEPLRAA